MVEERGATALLVVMIVSALVLLAQVALFRISQNELRFTQLLSSRAQATQAAHYSIARNPKMQPTQFSALIIRHLAHSPIPLTERAVAHHIHSSRKPTTPLPRWTQFASAAEATGCRFATKPRSGRLRRCLQSKTAVIFVDDDLRLRATDLGGRRGRDVYIVSTGSIEIDHLARPARLLHLIAVDQIAVSEVTCPTPLPGLALTPEKPAVRLYSGAADVALPHNVANCLTVCRFLVQAAHERGAADTSHCHLAADSRFWATQKPASGLFTTPSDTRP